MHYVIAIQITVQKFGNNRLVKYLRTWVCQWINRSWNSGCNIYQFTIMYLLWSQKLKNWEVVVSPLGFN